MDSKRSKMDGLLKRFPPGFDVTDLPELTERLYRNCFFFTNKFLNSLGGYRSEQHFNENLSKAVHKDLDSVRTNIITTRYLVHGVTMQGDFEPTSLENVALFLESFQTAVDHELGKRFHWKDFHKHVERLSVWIDKFVELKDRIVLSLEHLTEWPSPALCHTNLIIDTELRKGTSARHTDFDIQAGPDIMVKKIAGNCKQAIDMYKLMNRYPVRQFRKIDNFLDLSPCWGTLRGEFAVKQAAFNKAVMLISKTYLYRLFGLERDMVYIAKDLAMGQVNRFAFEDLTDDMLESLEIEYDDNLREIEPRCVPESQPLTDSENSTSDEEFSLDAESNFPWPSHVGVEIQHLSENEVVNAVQKIAGWSHRKLNEKITAANHFLQLDQDRFLAEYPALLSVDDLPKEADRSIQAVSEAVELYHRTMDEQHRLMIEVVFKVYCQTLSVLESFHIWAEDVEKKRLRGNEEMRKALKAARHWIKVLKEENEKLGNAKRLHNVILTLPELYGTIELYVTACLIYL